MKYEVRWYTNTSSIHFNSFQFESQIEASNIADRLYRSGCIVWICKYEN